MYTLSIMLKFHTDPHYQLGVLNFRYSFTIGVESTFGSSALD